MIKYVITLSTSEREELESMTSKGIHLSTKIKSALILLNCDTSEHSKRYTNQTISDIVHVFNGPATAKMIGWAPGSPFQYEEGLLTWPLALLPFSVSFFAEIFGWRQLLPIVSFYLPLW